MTTIRSQAYVLSRTPLTESSWIVCLLTRQEGKVSAVAKGGRRARSPFRGALEPLNLVRVEVGFREGRDLGSLLTADMEVSAFELFGSWPAAGVLMAVSETLYRGLPEHSAEEETFRLVGTVLQALREGAHPGLVWVYFAAWFLRLHGVLGRPHRCAACGEVKELGHFDAGAGGWLCGTCRAKGHDQGQEVSPEARALLGSIFRTALPLLASGSVGPEPLKNLRSMVYLALIAYLGRPLASGGEAIR
jgi:DNA repair protein RecO (recombination protein O)